MVKNIKLDGSVSSRRRNLAKGKSGLPLAENLASRAMARRKAVGYRSINIFKRFFAVMLLAFLDASILPSYSCTSLR